jgi:NitT/TauT family transport system ATP-binding protein
MSARPGRIQEVVPIDLDVERAAEADLRSSSRFATYRHHIWSLLRQQQVATAGLDDDKELVHV